MTTNRLEAFTDGVIAIIITVMLLEFKTPHGPHLQDLLPLLPEFATYLLSYVMLGIYWNNHHHMFHAAEHISGSVMWANLNLLFWLSMVPFATEWIQGSGFQSGPVALLGAFLLLSGIAFQILFQTLVKVNGPTSKLAQSFGRNHKMTGSIILYVLGIAASFVVPYLACFFYALVAMVWFVPDRRLAGMPPPSGSLNSE